MSRSLLSRAQDMFYGRVTYGRGPAGYAGKPGVKITPGVLVQNYGAIAAAVSTAVSASQSVTSATAALINGSLATAGVATFATARNVVAAWTNTAIVTIVGIDEYGSIVIETSASGTSHTGKKAFKAVTSITPNASITGFTAGNGNVIGLSYRCDANEFLVAKQTNAIDAATFVPADTATATGTTGDVRGTLDFATDADGTRTYAVFYKVADPSTKLGAYGILQFGSTDSA